MAKLEGIGDLTVVFRPSSLPSVAEITFKGNKAIPTTKLHNRGRARGGRRGIHGEPVPPGARRQRPSCYMKRWAISRVQFPKLDVAPARNVNGVAVTVEVQEGDIYKLGEVDIKGRTRREQGTSESRRLQDRRDGKLRSDSIRRRGNPQGAPAQGLSSRRRPVTTANSNAKDKTVNLTVNVDPGPQFTMGKLTIEGLDVETEPHIRKMFGHEERAALQRRVP